jgi:hypothetical protein
MNSLDFMLLAAEVILPFAFAFHVFLSRSRAYAARVKRAAIIVCLVGLAWGSLDWVILNFQLALETYDRLRGTRALLGGVCTGIVLSISLSRPYRKNVTSN